MQFSLTVARPGPSLPSGPSIAPLTPQRRRGSPEISPVSRHRDRTIDARHLMHRGRITRDPALPVQLPGFGFPQHTRALTRTASVRTRSPPPADRNRIKKINPFILPTDVDEHGHLLATVTTFPRNALKIIKDWDEHLPLHILTPGYIRNYLKHPTQDVAYAQPTADGSLALVSKQRGRVQLDRV